jgi:hypothetical protein
MSRCEIVGIALVRNEDRFLETALRNAAGFCDRFLLFDHESTDGSPEILARFAAEHPAATFRKIGHPSESQRALQPLAGRAIWVFGVDGDELYDPAGLQILKTRLLSGEFDSSWMVMGHCLHTEKIEKGEAVGFQAPPSRSITKLYNFAAIDAWPGESKERLHGGTPMFRRGFDASSKRLLFQESGWADSPLRCLHTCFCRRSSKDSPDPEVRQNIDEIYNRPNWISRLLSLWHRKPSGWKHERYRRGPLTTVSAAPFFP